MHIRRPAWLVLVVSLFVSPVLAGSDIHIDFDPQFDFSTIKTYAWVDDPRTSLSENNPFIHGRIIEVVDMRLSLSGIRKVETEPDVYIAYRAATTTDMSADGFGYFYPGTWLWDPYYWAWATPNMPNERTYTKGTLLIEAWTARTNQIIWRGSGSADVTSNMDKMNKRVVDLLVRISDKWRDMRAHPEREKSKAAATRPS
jgi:hypothetical protein